MQGNISIINKTKIRLPSLPFGVIKNDILNEDFVLSIAFVDKNKSQEINKKYRNKDNPTNILSFPFSKNMGEIVMCPSIIKNEVKIKKFDKNFRELIGFLVIHGMLHLKGLEHSSTMEAQEEKYDQKYFSGNRRGVVHDKSRGRGISKGRKKS